MADGITITLPGGMSRTIPFPANLPPLSPDQLAALEQEVAQQVTAAYPTALADLQAGLKSGDFTKFNADVTKVVNQVLNDFESLAPPPPCFTTGTCIRTERGELAVEDLAVGDLVVATSGERIAIKWIGHRLVNCARHPTPRDIMPVRVCANAFADNRPTRDLLLSPGHSVCVDLLGEVLIPVSSLINDTTIVQENADQITYWHVELEGGHNVLFAENLPCESYIEMGNRAFFAQGDLVDLVPSPDAIVVTHEHFCRPFHVAGPVVEAIRLRLIARVDELGWHHEVPDLDTCRLIVDGVAIVPKRRDMSLLFKVPSGSSEAWLVSSVGVPAETSAKSRDMRSLGLLVNGVVVSDGFSSATIAADDPRLDEGFYGSELVNGEARRWTSGRALLPSSLWQGMDDEMFIRIDVSSQLLPKWVRTAQQPRLALAA